MTKMTKWVLGGVAALAVSGLIYTMPALAAGNRPGGMHAMMQTFGGDMASMHSTMAPLMSQMPAMHTQMTSEVAQVLGISVEELNKALSDGKSLKDLAAEHKVGIGEVRAVMTRSMQAFLDKLVADKSITEEQAGRLLGFMAQHLDDCLSGDMNQMMSGMMGGAGMMGGMGGKGCH